MIFPPKKKKVIQYGRQHVSVSYTWDGRNLTGLVLNCFLGWFLCSHESAYDSVFSLPLLAKYMVWILFLLFTENQIRTNNTSTKMKLTKCKDDILQWKLNDLRILKVEQFGVFILLFLDPEIHLMCKQSDKVYTVIFISKSDFFLRKFLSSIYVEFRVLLYSMLGSKFHVLFCRHFEHLYFKN